MTRIARLGSAAALVLGVTIVALYAQQAKSSSTTLRLDTIKLPDGFSISIWAQGVKNARQMAIGSKGTVFVGSMQAGLVHAVVDTDGDHKADKTYVIAKGLEQPSGVAFKDGALYVADISKIYRFDDIEAHLATPPKPVLVTSAYPTEGHHGWKFIAFGPDGWLYVPVGAPCNVCDKRSENPVFASVTRIKPDGSGREVWAHGIRNSVGFDWHPVTKGLFITSNGRDMMGDDVPPDTLNYAPKAGMDFGFPYCHAGDVPDPEFGSKRPVQRVHEAGAEARRARGLDWRPLLHGHRVPGRVPQPAVHRRARLLEPHHARGLPHHRCHDRRAGQRHGLQAVRRGLAAGPRGVGTPGRRATVA